MERPAPCTGNGVACMRAGSGEGAEGVAAAFGEEGFLIGEGNADLSGEVEGGGGDAVDVETHFGELFVAFGVEDVVVGQTEAAEVRRGKSRLVGCLEDGRTEATHEATFLDREDEAAFLERLMDKGSIERLDEARIHDTDA